MPIALIAGIGRTSRRDDAASRAALRFVLDLQIEVWGAAASWAGRQERAAGPLLGLLTAGPMRARTAGVP